MGIVLDLILVLIVALCVIISVKRGFMKTVVEFVGFVLAIYIAFTFGPVLSDATYNNFVKPSISNEISEAITDASNAGSTQITNELWKKLPDFLTDNADKFGVSLEKIQSDISLDNVTDTSEISNNITDSVVKPVATAALDTIFSILLFLVISLLAKLLSKPINKLFSVSYVGKVNKALGVILGVGNGVVFSVLFCVIISSIIIFTKSGFLIFTRENIEDSTVFELLCKINSNF